MRYLALESAAGGSLVLVIIPSAQREMNACFFLFNRLYGALAQLVECHTGSVDVSGSNPLCSTKI